MPPRIDSHHQIIDFVDDRGRRWLGARQLNHLVRFAPVLELILAAGTPVGTLLDVGSGSQGIKALLPEGWAVTALDADFEDYAPTREAHCLAPYQQLGDVRGMSFRERSFDVTIAIDLLEHLAPEDRVQAISEICRVTRRRAVIACPAGNAALEGDRRVADRFTAAGRTKPGWLTEHLENGFPTADQVTAAAQPFGGVTVLPNENVHAHERLVWAENQALPAVALRLACWPLERLMSNRRADRRALASRILRRVRGADHAPAYRTVVIIDRPE